MNWSLFFSIIIGLFGISILVATHELGHFIFAGICRISIEKVQIGFGTPILTKVGKTGILYSIGFIPYGAFCKMDSYSLEQVHPLKKIVVYLAGPLFNIVFSIMCYVIYLVIIGTPFGSALKLSALQCLNELKMFYFAIGDILTGKAKIGETLSGIFSAALNIGSIARVGFENSFTVGLETALWLCASVSISLAFANLIPIPALDGGFIFLSVIEMITKHRFSEKFQIIFQCTGLFILFILFPIARLYL